MKYKEKRSAPLTICLVGAPGHAEAVYLSKENGIDVTKLKYKLC
jgi:hypothetical protein